MEQVPIPVWILIGLIGIVMIVIIYLTISIRIIGPTENGSGIHLLLPRFIEGVARYPTTQYKLDFAEREVITKRDVYRKYNDGRRKWDEVPPEEGEEKLRTYEAAKILVDTTVYFRWPQDQRLIAAYRSAPPPEFAQTLQDFFEDAVISRVRAVVGAISWRAAIENRDWIRDQVAEKLKEEPASPFHEAEIETISVVIEEIKLPEELEKAITLPQEEEYRRRGLEERARGQRALIREKGEGYRDLGFIGWLLAPILTLFDRIFGRTKIPGEE